MPKKILALKIDVDTERGTRIGVPNLAQRLNSLKIPATFLFSLGPDNTGRAIKRVFRRGFLQKVSRTSALSVYGFRTLLNGVLLPGPLIGKRHTDTMRNVRDQGYEVGIHCHDHVRWQDGVATMTAQEIAIEFGKAMTEFHRVFNEPAKAAGAPGWQANAKTLTAYDAATLLYGSDCRGYRPFYPRVGTQTFKTLQIPTTLPTLDELIGRPEFPPATWTAHYLRLLKNTDINILTVHAEIEGMKYLTWFTEFLKTLRQHDTQFQSLRDVATNALKNPSQIPVCELIQGSVDGRSGTVALQDA